MRFVLLIAMFSIHAFASETLKDLTYDDLAALEKKASEMDPATLDSDLRLEHMWRCEYRGRASGDPEYSTPMRFERMNGELKRWEPVGIYTEFHFQKNRLVRGKGFIDQATPLNLWSEKMARHAVGNLIYPHREVIRKLPTGELLIRLHYYDFDDPSPQGYLLCILPTEVS